MARITGGEAIARLKTIEIVGWTVIEHLTGTSNMTGLVTQTSPDLANNTRFWLDWTDLATEVAQPSICFIIGEVWSVEIINDRIVFLTRKDSANKPFQAPPDNAIQYTFFRTSW